MKTKFMFLIILCCIIGIYMGKFMINQYDDKSDLILVNDTIEELYFIQQGVYSSVDSMQENTTMLSHYIYSIEDNKYYVYIAITKEENLEKIKGYFNNLGYNIYVKKLNVNNEAFLEVLNQYEGMLTNTDDEKTIEAIIGQVLAKYEELVNEK